MQILIELPDKVYKELTETAIMVTEVYSSTIERALTEGVMLPKGHGPIVDVDVLKAVLPTYVFRNEQGHFCKISDIDKIPPFAVVIEADKEVDE